MEVTYETCGYEITMTDSDFRATKDGQVIIAATEPELLDRLNDT